MQLKIYKLKGNSTKVSDKYLVQLKDKTYMSFNEYAFHPTYGVVGRFQTVDLENYQQYTSCPKDIKELANKIYEQQR